MDITWSSLNQSRNRNGYFLLAANMDYSWVWWKKNFYGFVKFYFNSLGTDFYYGAHETEFGGYEIESTPYRNEPPVSIFLWLNRYL